MQAFLDGGHDPRSRACSELRLRARVKTNAGQSGQSSPSWPEVRRAGATARSASPTAATRPRCRSQRGDAFTNAPHQGHQADLADRLASVAGEASLTSTTSRAPSGFAGAKEALTSENYQTKKLVPIQEGARSPTTATPDRRIAAARAAEAADRRHRRVPEEGRQGDLHAAAARGQRVAAARRVTTSGARNDAVVDQVVRLFQGPQLQPDRQHVRRTPITRDIRSGRSSRSRAAWTSGRRSRARHRVSRRPARSSWAETNLTDALRRTDRHARGARRQGPVSIAVAVAAKAARHGDGEAPVSSSSATSFADNKNINTLYNRDLFLNSVGWLRQPGELLSIRPRTVRARASTSARSRRQRSSTSVLVIPELLMIIGLAVWWRRSTL